MTLADFNKELKTISLEESKISFVQKNLFHGLPFVFNGREADYFNFRKKIAENFNVSFHEVFIVGSAKLGFSYHKNTEFSYESDIDVVIVNEGLYESYFEKISDYQYQLDKQYHTVNIFEKQQYQGFLQYLIKGWMRPDKLPTSFQINIIKDDWFDFFKSISNGKAEVGNYKVAGGLFKNYKYLEKYYLNGVTEYYRKLTIGK